MLIFVVLPSDGRSFSLFPWHDGQQKTCIDYPLYKKLDPFCFLSYFFLATFVLVFGSVWYPFCSFSSFLNKPSCTFFLTFFAYKEKMLMKQLCGQWIVDCFSFSSCRMEVEPMVITVDDPNIDVQTPDDDLESDAYDQLYQSNDFIRWRKNAPYHYDMLFYELFECPSPTVQWLDYHAVKGDPKCDYYRLITGTQGGRSPTDSRNVLTGEFNARS
jgi:hypothetical protein